MKKIWAVCLLVILVFLTACSKAPPGSEAKMNTYVGPVEAYAEYIAKGINNKGVTSAPMLIEYLGKVTKNVCRDEIATLGKDLLKSDQYLVALTSELSENDMVESLKIIKKEEIEKSELDLATKDITSVFKDLYAKLTEIEKSAVNDENYYKTKCKNLGFTSNGLSKVVGEMKAICKKCENITYTKGYTLTITCHINGTNITDEFTMVVYEVNGYWTESTVYELITGIINALLEKM